MASFEFSTSPFHRIMNPSPRKPPLHFFFAFLAANLAGQAAEVSTKPPAIYESDIAPLLRPIEDVITQQIPDPGKNEPGTVVLAETVTRVEEDGKYVRAVRYIYQPHTEKGAEAITTDRFRFHSHLEKIHLVSARTILPGGGEKLPGPNAVFTQKATRASGSVYDDSEDLVVVFPDVKPGVICEVVVVYERTSPSVAGGHGELIFWTAGWPVVSKRHVVDMPASWGEKLAVHRLGATPRMTSPRAPEGRARREWVSGMIEPSTDEPNMAPVLQTGPLTWLTTFTDWDGVAAWYAGLLGQRIELGDELEALVDEWTADAAQPGRVLEILYDKVANDLRYEALAFGVSGLQPYPCATVWENQYGDCKDKSNLLAAMLRHRGIDARLSLINTRHAGLVRKEIPDFRHFDHAIVTVTLPAADGAEKVVFCDPTIRHGHPGLLTPSSAERDVLVVGDKKAEWLRTPCADAGTDEYLFDIELDEAGRISGWMTMKSSGYYAISLARSLAQLDRDTARSRLQDRVSRFIAGAEVVDFVLPELERAIDECEAKVYFACPPRPSDENQRVSLPMPSSGVHYNDFGDGKDRKTTFHMWPDRILVRANVRLPEGWAAETMFAFLELKTPHYEASAKWSTADGGYEGSIDIRCLVALIPPDQVAAAARVNRTLLSWLEIPLLLKRGADTAVKSETKPVNMPVMPTGDGQLELANRLYPRNGDRKQRSAALQQVLRDFSDEPETVFMTRTEIAYLSYLNGDYEIAERGFSKLDPAPAEVRQESIAYARFLRALSLKEMKRKDEAVAIMRTLAADKSISPYRRAWAANMAGNWLVTDTEEITEEALALLEQAVEMQEDASDTALDSLIPALAKAGKDARLVEVLADADIFEHSSDQGEFAIQSLAKADTPKAMAWLEKAIAQAVTPTHEKRLQNELSKLTASSELTAGMEKLRLSLVEWLRRERPDDFMGKPIPGGEAAETTEKRLDELASKDRAEWCRLMARYFEGFTAAPGFSRQLWLYLEHISNLPAGDQWLAKQIEAVMEIADTMPTKDPNYWEIRFVKAGWLTAHRRLAEAETMYREMRTHPDFDPDFEQSASHRLGGVLERLGKWDEAIASYTEFAEKRADYDSVAPHLLRAGVLLALSGREEKALETWKLLSDVPMKRYADSGFEEEIAEAITLAENPDETLAQWKVTAEWWEKRFLPWHAKLGGGAPGAYHAYFSAEADELNALCQPALAKGDIRILASELVRVAATARILPGYVQPLRQMQAIYLSPVRPDDAKAMNLPLSEIAAAHRVGLRHTVDLCQRLAAGLKLDLGDATYALENLNGHWHPENGGSAEHRERSGMLFCLAARITTQRLDEAISCTEHFLNEGPAFFTRSAWLGSKADLLVAAKRQSDAVALLKAAMELDVIADQPAELTAVKNKLTELEVLIDAGRDIGGAVAAFLEKHKPVWYDHVGPEDSSDPRLANPQALLEEQVAGFHETELFRARIITAMSTELTRDVRSQAFILATIQAGSWQPDIRTAVKLWKELVDDASLPSETRLKLLWRAAADASIKGRTEELAELMNCEVFPGFREDFRTVFFPMLVAQADIMASTTQENDAAAIKRIIPLKLDEIALSLAGGIHAALLTKGNEDGAKLMRDALKKWEMTPQAESRRTATRLEWARLAKTAANSLTAHRIMREAAGEVLRARAASAPKAWSARMDVNRMYDLPLDTRRAIHAKRLLSGIRYDKTELLPWLHSSPSLFSDGGQTSALKALDGLREVRDDRHVWLLMLGLLEAARDWEDWTEVDKRLVFFRNAEKFPATHALIRLWEDVRAYQPGDAFDITSHLGWISQLPYKPPFYSSLLEALLLNGDKAGLERVLDEVETEPLTDPPALAAYFEALAFLERTEELEIVKPAIEAAIQDLTRDAWLSASPSLFGQACDLAARYDGKALLSDAFLKQVPEMMGDPIEKLMSQAWVYVLREDWKQAIATLGEIKDEDCRNSADWNHLMGKSLLQSGKSEDAKKHLKAACKDATPGEMTHFHSRKLLKP